MVGEVGLVGGGMWKMVGEDVCVEVLFSIGRRHTSCSGVS